MFVRVANCINAFRTKPHNSLSSTRYQRHLFIRHENMCRAAISVERSDTKYQSLYLLLGAILSYYYATIRYFQQRVLEVNFGQVSLLMYVKWKVACKSLLNSIVSYYYCIRFGQYLPNSKGHGWFCSTTIASYSSFDRSAWHPLLVFTEKLHQRTNIPGNSWLGMQIVGPMWNQ